MLEPGSDIPGEHALVLILRQLVVAVGDLEPVARGEEVQVEGVLPVGLVVEAVEDAFVVALVMESCKFGRVQKAAAAGAIHGEEISGPGAAEAEPGAASGGPERSVRGVQVAKNPSRAQAGAREKQGARLVQRQRSGIPG